MKRLLFFLMMLLPMLAIAQNQKSLVILKNGTELTGVIKSIDPTNALVIVIAGVETTIKMSEVAKIDEISPQSNATSSNPSPNSDDSNEKVTVRDFADYPESFELKVGDQKIKMILVRGGDLNMGYDGRHSLSMKSEPVHKVNVTSFYISETFVTSEIVASVQGGKVKSGFHKERSWKKANAIIESIAKQTQLPLRLPTEAEWEYAACSSEQSRIFASCGGAEHCWDYFQAFSKMDYLTDPTGPEKGPKHVIRSFRSPRGKFDRAIDTLNIYFRLAIKAKDVKMK